ncbi:DUF3348 domain-containing protein [Xanthomonas sp. AmX2]|uniref:DUF3348 domain-containing protein n=1 Tax=Xanthomonas sp. TaxID=29446 RepID=UPI00197FC370|nr:DUF3348 domain-containing protein [Xanthomonas sp.]MBN6149974.1 DUF3348 domain-containing protein [Xanthomonas sp.]
MAKAPQRTPVPGPAFIRLLARLTDLDVAQSSPALSDRLSQWIDWTRAVALFKALDGALPAADAPGIDSGVEDECARVRASLAGTIAGLESLPASRPDAGQGGDADTAPDYAPFQRRCVDTQRAMQAATGRLRGRLRDMLAHRSADMARLAEVDAVMELTLSPREQALLGTVPVLLGTHFERLRQAEATAPAGDAAMPASATAASPGAWREVFVRDMRSVLLAELDVRFQPIEGLLAALRTR